MSTAAEPTTSSRPYFIPEGTDFDALSEPVRLAFRTIVEPAYQELVLGAPNPLERAQGATFVFLLAEEVLSQFELGLQMDLSQTQVAEDHERRERRERALSRMLRVLGAKNSALQALLRLRRLPLLARITPSVPPAA